MKTIVIDAGDEVICDVCNSSEYINSYGGMIDGDYAVCPCCAMTWKPRKRKTIVNCFLTFKDFILDFRKQNNF